MSYSVPEFLALGGPLVWPLAFCALAATVIIIERWMALATAQLHNQRFLADVADAVKRRKIAEALALCERARGPVAQLVRAGLAKHGLSRDDIRQALEEAGHREIPTLERNLSVLATIAQIAPLFGLLGTTLGLARCFQILQSKTAALQPIGPADLAQGIWPALLTTMAGLTIAIPAVIAYNYFARRAQRLVWDMRMAAGQLLALMTGEES